MNAVGTNNNVALDPMLPHLGQGANRSIEDGMALA
jgi:hypothetical protein